MQGRCTSREERPESRLPGILALLSTSTMNLFGTMLPGGLAFLILDGGNLAAQTLALLRRPARVKRPSDDEIFILCVKTKCSLRVKALWNELYIGCPGPRKYRAALNSGDKRNQECTKHVPRP